MQYHYVVYFDDQTNKWHVEDEVETYFHDGNIYDGAQDFGWTWPDDENEQAALIDQRCYNMLYALVPIWPAVDTTPYP